MGLDVYVGPLTRYYSFEWETIIQRAGREQGLEVRIARPPGFDFKPGQFAMVRVDLDGRVTLLTHAQHGPFRRLYLTPGQARERYAGRTWVPVAAALTDTQLTAIGAAGPVVLLALVGSGNPRLSTVGLLRATLAAAGLLPDAAVVAHASGGANRETG